MNDQAAIEIACGLFLILRTTYQLERCAFDYGQLIGSNTTNVRRPTTTTVQ